MDDLNKLRADIGKDNLARVIAFVGVYDDKAKFVLSIILAITAYLVTELPTYIDAHAKHPSDAWFVFLDLAVTGCLFSSMWAILLVVLTIRPNVTAHSQKRSPLFFQSIAVMPLDEFRSAMTSLSPEKAMELLSEQTYDNAKVVMIKHQRVHDAINRFMLGTACFLVFTIGRAILLALTP